MSRIASGKRTARLDLGSGEWIDVRAQVSFSQLQEIATDPNENATVQAKLSSAIAFAKLAVVDWNLLDENDEPTAYTAEKLGDLDLETMGLLQAFIAKQYGLDKKKEMPSTE